jgi:hypothetical protein
MRDPTVRILLGVFVGENRLESSPVQVQTDDISRSEGDLRQGREEEFIHDAISCHPNWGRFLGRRMGSNDDSHREFCPGQGNIRTIEESTAGSGFRMGSDLIRRLSQTSLDGRQIQQTVVFATRDVAVATACQIDHHRKISILPIQPQDGMIKGKLPTLENAGKSL